MTRERYICETRRSRKAKLRRAKRIKIPYIKTATIQIVHARRSKLKLCKRQKKRNKRARLVTSLSLIAIC